MSNSTTKKSSPIAVPAQTSKTSFWQLPSNEVQPQSNGFEAKEDSAGWQAIPNKGSDHNLIARSLLCSIQTLSETRDTQEKFQSEENIQTKLTLGTPGDPYEQEADRLAAQVMSMSVPFQMGSKQPLTAPTAQRQVNNQQVQMRELVQRAFQRGETVPGDLEGRLNGSGGGGSALAPSVRGFMEPRFGADFSGVRVHTGTEAVEMNRQLGAQAFTHGSDIYYGAGKSPGNNELTAHELTHVIQQGKSSPKAQFKEGSAQGSNSPLATSLSASPKQPQAVPAVTGITVGTELGVGRSLTASAIVGPGAGNRLTWTLVGAPAGVTIRPNGRQATIQAAAGALPSAGNNFQVKCELATTPGDNFTSGNITLVGITGVTYTPSPAFAPIAALVPATGPANTLDPNRGGLAGNTGTVNVVTAPAGRPTTITLKKPLGATVSGTTITPGTGTGQAMVKVEDTATHSTREEPLTINSVPLKLNGFGAQTPLGSPYGCLNPLSWSASDPSGAGSRIVGETITAGGRDDFGYTATVNSGPNPAPTLALAVPANVWADQLGTGAGPNAGAAGDANQINVNRYEGPGVGATFPRVWILRQGFHFMGWGGQWGDEFDNGIHRRSLVKTGANAFGFRTEHIFPGASSPVFNEPYVGPPLIVLSNVTTTPVTPAATALAADGVATANVTVATTVPGRQVTWNVVKGPLAFTAPAGGAAAPVATPATVVAGLVPGRYTVRIADSVFPNRRVEGSVNVARVALTGMAPALKTVPAGTLSTTVNVAANPGGRTVNWRVDGAAAAAGVTVVALAPGVPANPARSATVTRPAGFTGSVSVTASDSVLPARTASTVIRFR